MPGISRERLRQLDPTSYLSMDEFRELLRAQVELSKTVPRELRLRPPVQIMNSVDF